MHYLRGGPLPLPPPKGLIGFGFGAGFLGCFGLGGSAGIVHPFVFNVYTIAPDFPLPRHGNALGMALANRSDGLTQRHTATIWAKCRVPVAAPALVTRRRLICVPSVINVFRIVDALNADAPEITA